MSSLALQCAKFPVTSGIGVGVGTTACHKFIEGDSGLLRAFSLEGELANVPLTHSPHTCHPSILWLTSIFQYVPLKPEGFFWNGRRSPCHPVCARLEGLGNYYISRSSPQPVTLESWHINISSISPWGDNSQEMVCTFPPEFPWKNQYQLPSEITCLITHPSLAAFPSSFPFAHQVSQVHFPNELLPLESCFRVCFCGSPD